ncbi:MULTISPECIES: single-stranded-DNA-specific exonuclease RecJ [Psychrobacter]|uniref:single-stranded-DNA-specific exonuclease RecJ n=1 Tax=Psychrobacter TaxID=497 RepID=UPI00146DCEBF|nr:MULTISPECIES: single-stranded-DNA-specific exonuclease RecJ [Psychrobacter]
MLTLTPRFSAIEALPAALQPFAQHSLTLARLYASRGIENTDDLETSLAALLSAEDLLGIDDAVQLLDAAIDDQQKILIVGDFDCDGATSTALMIRVLRQMGAVVDFIVPDRFKYGYGLTPEIVDLAVELHHPELIVTVDNGISSAAGVARAHNAGIKVVITDHHLTTKPTPDAEAVVNPNQLGCPFKSKALVGVGVAFYVLGRLAKLRRDAQKSSAQVSKHLDLVALGTVADVGVLDKNNRILVHHGLNAIRQKRCCLGILALLEQASRAPEKLQAQDFGFILGPRINAAGRIEHMRVGIECLLADDWQTAQKLAFELDSLNRTRRQIEGKMREEAALIVETLDRQDDKDSQNSQDSQDSSFESNDSKSNCAKSSKNDKTQNKNNRSLILYQPNWHQGVIGIVAGRLKERYYLPSIVFAPADVTKTDADDLIKGSARSIDGIHIRDAIENVAESHPELISHFGGHAMAAGLTIQRKNFDAFAKAFNDAMNEVDSAVFTPQTLTDGELMPQDFSLSFADFINNASIWGHGFAKPIFDGVFEVLNFKVLKDKHLKLNLRYANVQYPIEAIYFNFDPETWDYRAQSVHVLFELDINEWRGNQSLQLMVRDLAIVNCR